MFKIINNKIIVAKTISIIPISMFPIPRLAKKELFILSTSYLLNFYHFKLCLTTLKASP